MMLRLFTLLSSLALISAFAFPTSAQQHSASSTTSNVPTASPAAPAANHPSPSPNSRTTYYDARTLRIKGEQAFRTNCGRCHQPPHKFPPRVMAAAIRHMRVRAMLTDEDMRLILLYMTQ